MQRSEIVSTETAGNTFTLGDFEYVSQQPAVEVALSVSPGQWERMAAKIVLALLTDVRPPSWRTSACTREANGSGIQRSLRADRPIVIRRRPKAKVSASRSGDFTINSAME